MNTTTPTINGLRLVSPEECGKKTIDTRGDTVVAVLLNGDHPMLSFWTNGKGDVIWGGVGCLVDLPKPRTTRPYKRGEVKCGDVFRRKACGYDYLVTRVCNDNVFLGGDYGETTCKILLDQFDKLTYDSEGREVLSEAGQVEE